MYSKLVIVGYVGQAPELRYLPDGSAVTNFSVATKVGFGEKRYTLWYRVSCFGQQAEFIAKNVNKGVRVLVDGTLRGDPATGNPRIYTRNDGTAAASYEVYADTVRVIDWAEQAEGSENGESNL